MSALIPLGPLQTPPLSNEAPKEKKSRGSKRHRHHRHEHKQTHASKKSCLDVFLKHEILPPEHDCRDLYFFEKEFREIRSVAMGTGKVANFGEKLATRGVSTCIAVAAIAFNHQHEASRVGLAHYSGEGPNLAKFFSKLTAGDISEVKITLVGGQGKNPDEDPNCRVVLQSIAANPLLVIDKIVFNPWEVPEDWEDCDILRRINPSAAVGISEDGKVVVSDEIGIRFRNIMGGFTKFAHALAKLRDQDSQGQS